MKGFERKDHLLSLCGLNCGLCPMRLGNYCGGCGNGNQSCRIARCSLEHGGIEYCSECAEYPCAEYLDAEERDSFITHIRQKADLEKAGRIGIEEYSREQEEKVKALDYLMANFNDGRRKSFFCLAVNLLDLCDIRQALDQIDSYRTMPAMTAREKALHAVGVLQELAQRKGIVLKLRRGK